jgi:hypothetical protein
MTNVNRYGLSRTVPPDIQEQIRKRCGFGCVICGTCFYDYEHFDPDFVDAQAHHPDGMTLLCMQCNQKRKRGILSRETVARCNLAPKCLQQGFAREWLDYGIHPITIALGSCTSSWGNVLTVGNESILAVREPFAPGMPWRLSAKFADHLGRPTLTIDDNHLIVHSSNWDVIPKGPRVIVRPQKGKRSLVLKMEPPTMICIERMDMNWAGRSIRADKRKLKFKYPGNDEWVTLEGVHVDSSLGMGFIRI